MAVKKGAVVIDTKLNHEKITQEFKNLEKTTQSLINKYNKSVDSIKSQELAIQKVKDEIVNLQLYAQTDLIKDNEVKKLDNLTSKLPLLESKLSQTKTEAKQTAKAIEEAFDKKSDIRQLENGFKDVGNKIEKMGSKIIKTMISIAVFDVAREGLRKLRDEIVSALKINDTFNSSLNQIKANLMTAFAPIYNAILPAVNSLMNVLTKLTGTMAMFISGLFGKSIKKSTKEAENLSNALKDVDKNGSKATGSLASFDKLEIISGEKTTTDTTEGLNYSQEIVYSQSLLDFLNRIKTFISENQELILGFFVGITVGLMLIKVGLTNIQSLGIGIMVAGIISLILSLIEYLKDPTFENFGKIITSIGLILLGLGIIIGNVPLIIAAAIVIISGLLVKNYDNVVNFGKKIIKWIDDNMGKIKEKFGIIGVIIATAIQMAVEYALSFFQDFFTGAKKIIDGIIKIFKGDFKGGIKDVFSGLKTIFLAPINALIAGMNKLISGLNKIKIPDWVPIFGGKNFKIPKIPELAQGAVIPPRQKFMAILGDQKHGTNIEAPLETIKQANREVLQEFLNNFNGLNSQESEIVLRNLTIIANFGERNFQKLVIDSVRLSEKEMGKPLFVN